MTFDAALGGFVSNGEEDHSNRDNKIETNTQIDMLLVQRYGPCGGLEACEMACNAYPFNKCIA